MSKKTDLLKLIPEQGILPLYFYKDTEVSIQVLKTLYNAGIRTVEYTNRGEAALHNFKEMREVCDAELPGMFFGIGTIKNGAAAQTFIDAGADYIICPGLIEEVATVADQHNMLWVPGCMTPSEIIRAENLGAKMIKLFPGTTVIASQAVISGAFSVTRQAVQLGFLPRLTIRHTSAEEIGQVYVPAVNWGLYVAIVGLVIGFGSSAALASAYGIAVTGTMAVDTLLFLVVARVLWRRPPWMIAVGAVVFLTIDLAFLAANLTKVAHGGWFPLSVGVLVYIVLTTWDTGRKQVTTRRIFEEGPLRLFVKEMHRSGPGSPVVTRVPGTAVFLNARNDTAPLALRALVEHSHVLHESVVILSIKTEKSPHVPEAEQLSVDDLGYRDDGITHLTARLGFQDSPNVPRLMELARDEGLERAIDVDHATYYLSSIVIVPGKRGGMVYWRKRIFMFLSRNAASPVEYFALPSERTVLIGSQIGL